MLDLMLVGGDPLPRRRRAGDRRWL